MTDPQKDTTSVNLIAIDIAKDSNVVLVQEANGARRSFRVANNHQDHEKLVAYIQGLKGHVRVALEPTADYHRPIAYRLLRAGCEVVSVSSVAQARFREARYGTWDKNDPKDAQVILAMMQQGLIQTFYDPLINGTQDWQELSNTYFHITLARTRVQHSLLLHYLPLYFPEFIPYWQSTRSAWFIRFLLRFPTPASIRLMDQEAFIAEAWELIGRKVNKRTKLEEIYARAGASIALPVALDSPTIEAFRIQLTHYAELNAKRQYLDERARELLTGHPDFERLCTLPGIAAVNALVILAEGGDLRRFHHHRQFLKYCGLDLAKTQSGQTRGRETLSKRGNKRLRLVFWMAGLRAVHQNDNVFRDKYERYIRVNPYDPDLKRKALTAVAAKMARVTYAVITTETPYQRFFEHRLPSGLIPLARAVEATSTS